MTVVPIHAGVSVPVSAAWGTGVDFGYDPQSGMG